MALVRDVSVVRKLNVMLVLNRKTLGLQGARGINS